MYRFKSKADGDLIMMTPVAEQILRIVGREPAERGIIEVAALPQAIQALEQAIADADKAQREGRGAAPEPDDERGANAVGLQQRAWPMLEMMRRSLAERSDIVWGV